MKFIVIAGLDPAIHAVKRASANVSIAAVQHGLPGQARQ
jgi:hypothetical protein